LVSSPQLFGYTVFGKVVEGMDVILKMKSAPTGAGGPFPSDVPKTPIVINSAIVIK
jgi:peptidyl-prolyl cis-trans isomerase A (cyclophilin A)